MKNLLVRSAVVASLVVVSGGLGACKKDPPAAAPAAAKKPGLNEAVEVKLRGGTTIKVTVQRYVRVVGASFKPMEGTELVAIIAHIDLTKPEDMGALEKEQSALSDGKRTNGEITPDVFGPPPPEFLALLKRTEKSIDGFSFYAVPKDALDKQELQFGDKKFALGKPVDMQVSALPVIPDAGPVLNAAMTGDAAALINAVAGDAGALVNAALSGDAAALIQAGTQEADAGAGEAGADDDDDGKSE